MIGLLTPFQRDRKRDFAHGDGPALAQSMVAQVLLTECTTPRHAGELPWRTEFGCGLYVLRHGPMDSVARELLQTYIEDAFARWLPAFKLIACSIRQDNSCWQVDLTFTDESGGLQVFAAPLER